MVYVQIACGVPGVLLMVHAFRHYYDVPDFDWHTMKCTHPGKVNRKD